jgi:hypothetical protein
LDDWIEQFVPGRQLLERKSATTNLQPFLFNREEHISRKVDSMIKEAKEKMAKGDKKGKRS